CDVIPQSVGTDLSLPVINLNSVVLEGGAIEHDGHGTMMATRSSITHSSRNPNLTEAQIEDTLTTYMGITKFIWLDGVYGSDITDMHIDGFVKFANDSTIVTMSNSDLQYWLVSTSDINIINSATNALDVPYDIVTVPLTQNNVVTTYGTDLGYKGSYCNYYIANDVLLIPTYNDPNDATAISVIQGIYPTRTAIGIDVRNLYEYGGMIHCITQQQPVGLTGTGLNNATTPIQLIQNTPNPFADRTTVNFHSEANASVTLDVYNALGQNVKTLVPAASANQIVISAPDFEAGIYLYVLKSNGVIIGQNKMVISK
ncbi:MAG: hypothetical protein ACI9YU_001826, partial [Flavobacteriales bacterium]